MKNKIALKNIKILILILTTFLIGCSRHLGVYEISYTHKNNLSKAVAKEEFVPYIYLISSSDFKFRIWVKAKEKYYFDKNIPVNIIEFEKKYPWNFLFDGMMAKIWFWAPMSLVFEVWACITYLPYKPNFRLINQDPLTDFLSRVFGGYGRDLYRYTNISNFWRLIKLEDELRKTIKEEDTKFVINIKRPDQKDVLLDWFLWFNPFKGMGFFSGSYYGVAWDGITEQTKRIEYKNEIYVSRKIKIDRAEICLNDEKFDCAVDNYNYNDACAIDFEINLDWLGELKLFLGEGMKLIIYIDNEKYLCNINYPFEQEINFVKN